MKRFIIYSRRSKVRKSGKQLTHETAEWQVKQYLSQLDEQNIPYEIVDHIAEDISGYGYYTKRPLFSSIVTRCKEDKSVTLLASKHDRIARDSWTGSELLKTIDMVVASSPDADDFTHQILFSAAEKEVKSQSDRWKMTAAAKKARCKQQGVEFEWGASSDKYKRNPTNPNAVRAKKAKTSTIGVAKVIKTCILSLNKPTYQRIASVLTEQAEPTPSGAIKPWQAIQVKRVCERHEINIYK